MKRNYLKLLTENTTELPASYDLTALYKTLQILEPELDFDEFKDDFIEFLKRKKVKDFKVLNDTVVKINEFASLDMRFILKYFKIGTDVLSIDSRILYSSWKLKNEKSYEIFIKEFKNYLASINRNDSYFIFETRFNFQAMNRKN